MRLPKAYSQYGASMGRRDNITEPAYHVKFQLQKMQINSGGYDTGGAYWGVGMPMYHAAGYGAEELQEMFFRARDRAQAREIVKAKFKNCKFWR